MIKIEDVQDKVLQLRNENVIIDSDVARCMAWKQNESTKRSKKVGATGFEPATSCTPYKHSYRTELYPD